MLLLVPAQPLSARQEHGQKSHNQSQGKVLVLLPPSKNLASDTVVPTSSLLPLAMEPTDDNISDSIDNKFTLLPLIHDENIAGTSSPDPNILESTTPTRPGIFRHSSLPVSRGMGMLPSRPLDRRASFHSRTAGRLSTGSAVLKAAFKRTLTVRSPLLTSVSSGVPVGILETEKVRHIIGAETQDKRKRPPLDTSGLKEASSIRREQEGYPSVRCINVREESQMDKPVQSSEREEGSLKPTPQQRDVAVESSVGQQNSGHIHGDEDKDGDDDEIEKSDDNVSCVMDESGTRYITLEMASLNVVLTPRQVQELHYQQRKQARRKRLQHTTTARISTLQSRRSGRSSQAGHLFPIVVPPAAPLCPSAIPASYHIPLSAFRTSATVAVEEEEARSSKTK
ncbi:hypothetical protein BGZ81_005373 [Podila clonocystis]|nr:hypothetical protein BGZ81_005373 [Podila clonocystis]